MAKRRSGPRMQNIATIQEALDVLGGELAVADWLQTTKNNVIMMRIRNYVPRGYHLHFYMTLRERGYQPAPELFDLKSFDRLIMPRLRRRKAKTVKRVAA